ncbi:hypothetical protein V6N13_066973 [Hibiscus sabdariffa]|uniref:Uncharacterized protein n=1 Tax=Hibiscus sabdariffa TaxID=183260 RepID=A0ABR2DSD7_9ROSI
MNVSLQLGFTSPPQSGPVLHAFSRTFKACIGNIHAWQTGVVVVGVHLAISWWSNSACIFDWHCIKLIKADEKGSCDRLIKTSEEIDVISQD